MSALSSIAEKPHRVENMFLNDSNEIEKKGVYGIKLYALGVPHTVLVDDFIPMRYKKKKHHVLFGGVEGMEHGGDKSLWGLIFEKAFAKFYGNYEHTVGGFSYKAL